MTARTPPSDQPRAATSPGHGGSRPGREAGDRRLGRALLAIAAVWAVTGIYVVHSQLPSNTLELPGQDTVRTGIQVVAPQGWAFFTKSPRDPHLVVWAPSADGGWERALYAPHSEPRNAFGLNRRSRAQPVEMGLLIATVPAEQWLDRDHGDIPTDTIANWLRRITQHRLSPRPRRG